jgi:hypothetical protein
MVADRLRGLQEELGLAGILAEMNCGGLIPQERMMPATATELQLMCEKVQSRLHRNLHGVSVSARGGEG